MERLRESDGAEALDALALDPLALGEVQEPVRRALAGERVPEPRLLAERSRAGHLPPVGVFVQRQCLATERLAGSIPRSHEGERLEGLPETHVATRDRQERLSRTVACLAHFLAHRSHVDTASGGTGSDGGAVSDASG